MIKSPQHFFVLQTCTLFESKPFTTNNCLPNQFMQNTTTLTENIADNCQTINIP